MDFSGLAISSVSFDYEIFPDGSCPSLSKCGKNDSNLPDFTFDANGNQIFQTFGVVPGTDGTYSYSPASPYKSKTSKHEAAPQLLGTFRGHFQRR